jgi:hypothetical protein
LSSIVRHLLGGAAGLALGLLGASDARAGERMTGADGDRFVRQARALMREMKRESRRDSERIHAAYGSWVADRALRDRASMSAAISEGLAASDPEPKVRDTAKALLRGAPPP